jgi:FdhD protein
MTDPGSYPVTYTGYYDAERRPVQGVVPVEEAVALHVNGQPLVVLMCTPTQLEELALGFLFGAGLIEGRDDVNEVQVLELPDGRRWLDVWLHREIEPPKLRAITSGCSGGVAFESAGVAQRRVESTLRVTPQQVTRLMDEFLRATVLYRRAGGVHGAALADGERLLCVAEDIGRHNALDKIAGFCLRQGLPMRDCILLTTGRISSEMVDKAARMGVPVVVSRTAPTSLALRRAQEWGIALIGYTRRRTFRVYTGAERVTAPECRPQDESQAS